MHSKCILINTYEKVLSVKFRQFFHIFVTSFSQGLTIHMEKEKTAEEKRKEVLERIATPKSSHTAKTGKEPTVKVEEAESQVDNLDDDDNEDQDETQDETLSSEDIGALKNEYASALVNALQTYVMYKEYVKSLCYIANQNNKI